VAFSSDDFKRINGFPNNFWGWGGEDDEMRNRIDEVRPPTGSSDGGGSSIITISSGFGCYYDDDVIRWG